MKRRGFVCAAGAASLAGVTLPTALRAQSERPGLHAQGQRMKRLGTLAHAPGVPAEVFRQALKDRGWEVGRNLTLEQRWAAGDATRFPALARELVAAGVDVILALGDAAAEASVQASRTVPVVMQGLAPVEIGLAKSLARPGGNVTGVVYLAHEYAGKQIDLLRAMRPDLRRAGIVNPPDSRLTRIWHRGWKDAAERVGVTLVTVPYPATVAGIDDTLAAAERERVQSLEFGLNFMLRGAGWQKIRAWALPQRVLTSSAEYGRGEAMLAFGANGPRFFALLMDQLDRVLHGANPAELPIQQPTVFDIVVDRAQVQAMGLTVPRSVLLQATEVIG